MSGGLVMVCSAEVEDLAAICDRVLILQDGRIAREMTRPFDADAILATIFAVDDAAQASPSATTPAGEV